MLADSARYAWLPDNRRLLELQIGSKGAGRTLLWRLDTPDQPGVPFETPADAKALLGVTPDGRVLYSDYHIESGKAADSINLIEVGFYPNATSARKLPVSLPKDSRLREIVLSPQGDRIAWLFSVEHVSPVLAFLAKYLPVFMKSARPNYSTELWISRGTDGRCVSSHPRSMSGVSGKCLKICTGRPTDAASVFSTVSGSLHCLWSISADEEGHRYIDLP